ncbi:MAG: DUF4192 domain-containing protein [Actinobacteria bacterium]|nr:DUF4192 domain-containing protein [Actinomycetota bacterium]
MTNPDAPRIRLGTAGDVVQIVPYLIGFQPEESLVIMVLNQGTLAVTARANLADVQSNRNLDQLISRIWARFPGADAIMLAYTGDHSIGWDTLHRADSRLPRSAHSQQLLVDGNTWHQPDGTTGTLDPDSPVATQAARAGLNTHSRRSDLAPRFASAEDSDELLQKVTRVAGRLPDPSDDRRLINAFSDLLVANLPNPTVNRPSQSMSSDDAIALALLSQNPAVREVALLSMTRDTAAQHLQLWGDVINHTPSYGSEQPLHLAGLAAWLTGEGALASMAMERAKATALPGHPRRTELVGDLLGQLIDHVVPPSTWDKLRPQGLALASGIVRAGVEKVTGRETLETWETVNAPTHTTRHAPRNPTPPRPGIPL